ncbi:hypothetical protein OSB04_007899 [Centaurea solstitialis]|uniref:Uncharacterized protein n=1 Tax=Centaurea solstitialis TaxID=347529 RepID=A0AA38TKS2_9ASTR|nr:hypothetical protein OSB04_007899 [Centaurea solstitialis]
MASTSYMYVFVLALLSVTSNEMCYASRNLLQTSPTQPQIPTIPTLPQPQMPTIPTLPQPQMPTMPSLPQPQIPTLPTLPQPQMPTIPTLPNMPKVSLPPLPSMPTIPNLPTTLPKIPFFAPPPSKKETERFNIHASSNKTSVHTLKFRKGYGGTRQNNTLLITRNPTMASTSYVYILILALFSIMNNEMCYASRNLLLATPTVPQPQMPPYQHSHSHKYQPFRHSHNHKSPPFQHCHSHKYPQSPLSLTYRKFPFLHCLLCLQCPQSQTFQQLFLIFLSLLQHLPRSRL